jgi:hypothetical protein
MALKYALFDNKMTEDPDDYMAIIQEAQNKNLDDIIKQITVAGSILKETECRAVIRDFLKKLAENAQEGIGFLNDYFSINFSIQGVFKDADDRYDPKRHSILMNLTANTELKKSLDFIKVEKVSPNIPQPIVHQLYDMLSNTTNATLSGNGMAEIKGEKLSINTAEADEGIFLINVATATETKVSLIHNNEPKKLQFLVPTGLQAGTYKVEVRNRAHRGKDIRKGVLGVDLTVV